MSKSFTSMRRVTRALSISVLTLSVMLASASVAQAAGVQAGTVKTGDTGNGKIDFITVQFNVPMRTATTPKAAPSPGEPGFWVDGYSITGFTWPSATLLRINLAEGPSFDGTATPGVSYEPGGDAISALGIEADGFAKTAADGAGPVLVQVLVHDAGQPGAFNARPNGALKGDEVTLVFSEPTTLLGATKLDRWSNLEKAIRFNNAGGGCTFDGQGLNTAFNFPQPGTAQEALDPIVEPANSSAATTTFRIRHQATALNSTPQPFTAVPNGCWVGVEPGTINTGNLIVGADGNAAITQTAGPGVAQPMPTPVDAALVTAALDPVVTKDGLGGPRDGVLDAVTLTFDQNIDVDSVSAATLPSITLGSTTAIVDPAAVALGAPNQLVIPFTLPSGVQWDTGERPSVRYVKPSACTATAGTPGLKAKVPSGGTWRTCVGSFDYQAHDRAAPLALTAHTTDLDGNGRLDRVTVTFSESISQGTAIGWTLNGQPATGFNISVDGRRAEIPFTEAVSGDTGSTASVAYATQSVGSQQTRDSWNNQVVAANLPAADGAAPRIVTASLHDIDGDGSLDRAQLTFSEDLVEPAAGVASAFRVGGVPATGFAPGAGDEPGDDTLTLAIDVPGTGARGITYAGTGIVDARGNVSGTQVLDATEVVDQAAPLGTISVSPSAPLGIGTSTVSVRFTEEMDTGTAPTVMLGSTPVQAATGEHTNGFRDDDPSVWEGTVSVSEGDCGTPTGCAVQVTASGGLDLGGIAQQASSLATEIDTIAPQPPTLGAFSATVPAGNTVPGDTINGATTAISLAADVVAGDAAGGTAELLVDGEALPDSLTGPIAPGATSVSADRSFADADELRSLLEEGMHELAIRVCDDAGNCASSATAQSVLVDTLAVDVELTSPAGGDIAGGGDLRTITWNADEGAGDLDHVELDLSTNGGTSFAAIDHAITDADGSFDWTVPSIDAANAVIRVVTVDLSGNRAVSASEAFSIDSTAPVVAVDGPAGTFLPAGGTTLVQWSATDATLHRAQDPITIEYSTDDGATWLPLNGGSYSHADDGAELWRVPAVRGFGLLVRVTATDATGKATTVLSERLAAGVGGYVADARGRVHAFGTADGRTGESDTRAGDWVAGISIAPNGQSGYVLSRWGALKPYSIDGASKPAARRVKVGGANAVDVVQKSKWKGYVLDKHGNIHAFGRTPKARPSRTWRCDCARAIVLNQDHTGGYVLNAYGKAFPFAIGRNAMPPAIKGRAPFSSKVARDLVLNSDGRSGYVLRKDGKVFGFGGAPARSVSGRSWKAGAQALIRVTDAGGYWVDATGRLHRYGEAFGDPTRTVLNGSPARGAIG